MQMRRLRRLTNAFSKKLSHLKAALGLHFGVAQLRARTQHRGSTPAMEAGIADHVLGIR